MQKYLFYIICLLISLTMVCCSENDSDNSPKTTIPTKIEEDSINTKDDTNKVDTIYFQIQKDNIILSIYPYSFIPPPLFTPLPLYPFTAFVIELNYFRFYTS